MFRLLRVWAAVGTGLYLLYLRFVSEEDKDTVAKLGFAVPVIGMVTQIVFAIFWGWYFERTKVRLSLDYISLRQILPPCEIV